MLIADKEHHEITKTSHSDLGVLLDSSWSKWLASVLPGLRRGLPTEPAWGFSCNQLLEPFLKAAAVIDMLELTDFSAHGHWADYLALPSATRGRIEDLASSVEAIVLG